MWGFVAHMYKDAHLKTHTLLEIMQGYRCKYAYNLEHINPV